MATKIIKMTDNSWIIKGGHKKIGILHKDTNNCYLFYPIDGEKKEFSSYVELEKYFGKLTIEGEKNISDNINGYPIKHLDSEVIDQENLIYVKSGSKIKFLAGYYGFKQKAGWVVNFCPKQSTYEAYETIGPFRSKLECTVEVQHKNTEESNGRSY